jgi:predicted DsbA family dithiol-disulfide isomerase
MCDAPEMDQRVPVRVYYDFASSLSYVAHRVMERLDAELTALAVDLDWAPLDLTGITGWPRGAAIEGPRRANALRVARELRVAVRMPTRWPDSRPANAVALALAGTPQAPAWRERVYSAIHEEGRCLDDPGILDALGRDLGIAAAELADPGGLAALAAESSRARRANVTGVPTFLLSEWPIGGIQEERVMRSLLERWAQKVRRGSSTGADGR